MRSFWKALSLSISTPKQSFWLNADYLKKVIANLQSVPNR